LIHDWLEFHGITLARHGSVFVSQNSIKPALTIVAFPPYRFLLISGKLMIKKNRLKLLQSPGKVNMITRN